MRLFFILGFICLTHHLNSQSQKDSIYIQKHLDSIHKANMDGEFQKAFKIINKGLDYANKHTILKTQIVELLSTKEFYFSMLKKHDSSYYYSKKIIAIYKSDSTLYGKKTTEFCSTIFTLSSLEQSNGNYHAAYKLLKDALNRIPNNKTEDLCRLHLSLADLNMLMNYRKEALYHTKKAENLGNIGKLNKSLVYMTLSDIYKTTHLDSSYHYLSLANQYYNANRHRLFSENTYYANNVSIAVILLKRGDIKKAKRLLIEAKEFQEKHIELNCTLLSKTYLQLAKVALYENNKKHERKLLKKSEVFAQNVTFLPYKKRLYEAYITYYDRNKEFKNKLAYEKKLQQVKDTINNISKIFLAKELETKYDVAIKKKTIQYQNNLITSQKRHKTILYIALLLLLVILTLSYFFYQNKIKLQKKIVAKQKELATEKELSFLQEKKVTSIQAHLEGQNKERNRIAKDLHDNINGNIAAIKMKLINLDKNHSKGIESIITNLDATYNEVRVLSHNLLVQKRHYRTFTEMLYNLIDLYKSKNLEIQLTIFPEDEVENIPDSQQVELYKILQELITNIIKHANASSATIDIIIHDDYINTLIEDNGIGFNASIVKKGIGLKNILSRIEDLNGTMEIASVPNKGTTININIPV